VAEQEVVQDAEVVEEEILSRELPIAYYGTEDVIAVFADQAMVSSSPSLFTLFFFQMQVPPTTDMEVLRTMDKIPAKCVGKILLTPSLMEQFFTALEGNIKKRKARLERFAALEKDKE